MSIYFSLICFCLFLLLNTIQAKNLTSHHSLISAAYDDFIDEWMASIEHLESPSEGSTNGQLEQQLHGIIYDDSDDEQRLKDSKDDQLDERTNSQLEQQLHEAMYDDDEQRLKDSKDDQLDERTNSQLEQQLHEAMYDDYDDEQRLKHSKDDPLDERTNSQLEQELHEAMYDDDEQRLKDSKDDPLDERTNSQLEQELHEAMYDDDGDDEQRLKHSKDDQSNERNENDAYVPSPSDDSFFNQSDIDDFDNLTLAMTSSQNEKDKIESFPLNRAGFGNIPAGISEQEYSLLDKIKLIKLCQSNKIEERKELFNFIAKHTHIKYASSVSNLKKWIQKQRSDAPILYRNCIPCTNAVDLNFQSLFNNHINLNELKYYSVNTSDMKTEWISYVRDLEHLQVDLNRYPGTIFTDVIRGNLIPNHRYIIQGLVVSGRGINSLDSSHVCNLINDERGHIWILDGQIERVFDFNQPADIKALNQLYRPDHVYRALTGLFRPTSLV